MTGLPIKTNLEYLYGDSFSGVEVIWEDVEGNPIDLTDFLASMQVKNSRGDVLMYLDSDVETGLELEPTEGKVIINAAATKMVSGGLVPKEIYDYDIQVKSDDGLTVRTLMFGKFSVHEEVTEV